MNNQLIKKFIQKHSLSTDEYEEIIGMYTEKEAVEILRSEAVRLRRKYYGDRVFIRGLIEFTNICKNNCYYCGIRCENKNIERYRLGREEILMCCEDGYRLGFRTFVLQGGEDMYYTDELMADIIRSIKEKYPDCAITLSIGERSFESYRTFKNAGADRYLLRHETADEEHYRKLHPESMSLENRKQCLYNLKKLGYQVGAGFMVGSPYQTLRSLALDMSFIQELEPEMVGIGPFIPHHDTGFRDEPAGSVELTLYLLSVLRIMHPWVLLPATTALGTLAADGRERGLLSGANVVMPNLSPVGNRKKYELYDHKICTGEESAQCIKCLENRVLSTGYRIVVEQGNCEKNGFKKA
jgi:biotin synthase